MTDIIWTGNRNDYTAQVDGYTLRAIRIENNHWYWAFKSGKHILVCGYVEREEHAKSEAIEAMNEHKQNQ
jgi:hypothetical protein